MLTGEECAAWAVPVACSKSDAGGGPFPRSNPQKPEKTV